MAESRSEFNPLVIGAAVVGGAIVGIVVAVKFFTGQTEEPKKTIETPVPSSTGANSNFVSGLEQHVAQAKKMEEELKVVKGENETQKDAIEKQKQAIQKLESALLQKDTEISGLKSTSQQQVEGLKALNLKLTAVTEENNNLRSQVAQFQSVGRAFHQVSQSVTPAEPTPNPKPVEKTPPPVSPSTTVVPAQPIKHRRDSDSNSEFSPDHDSSGQSRQQDILSKEGLARNPSQASVFQSLDEKELFLNSEKNTIIQELTGLCSNKSLNENENLVAKCMMVHILLYKNEKTISDIFNNISSVISKKISIATDLPTLNGIITKNLNVQDKFDKRELNLNEANLFSNHFKKAKQYLPDDATASTLFGHIAKIKQGKQLDREQVTLEYYTQHFLKKLKPTVNEVANVPK